MEKDSKMYGSHLWVHFNVFLNYLENIKCLNPWYKMGIRSMKPNNPMIGKTFPIKEMKPINVHINVMIAIIMMRTKYPLENGSVNLEANAYIRPTIVL